MHYKVVIIGAGMAGLGAAQALVKLGCTDLVILEAQHLAGGRISTAALNEGIIELGAQWLHGTDNQLFDLAVEHNLIHEKTSDEALGIFIRNDGYLLDDFLVRKVNFVIGKILEACEEFKDSDSFPKSVGHYLEEEFTKYLQNSNKSDKIKEQMLELYDWNVKFQLIDNSCADLKSLSAKDWGKYSCLGKDGQQHLNIKGGYGTLVEKLLETLPENTVIYNKIVEEISQTDVTNGKVIIKCNDCTFSADFVIFTPSVSALKQIKFSQNLKLPEAFEAIGMEGMGKVFLVFESRWWSHEGFQLIWKHNTSDNWTQHFTGFDSVLEQPNVLMGWISALGLQQMEDLSEEQVGQQCVDLLRVFLKDLYDFIPYPVKVFRSKWASNRFIGGSYSYPSSKCDLLRIDCHDALLEPFKDTQSENKRIFYAGEAANSSHFSTTHGAFESGLQQAAKIIAIANIH